MTPPRSSPQPPSHDEPPALPGRGLLIEGDNLRAAPLLAPFTGRVDLIYLDPPFDTGDSFAMRAPARGEAAAPQGLAYRDRWPTAAHYMEFLHARLALCRELLAPAGVLYVHLDLRRVHHARLLLDRIFGEECLEGEIIWHYRSGGRSTRFFASKHETILVYRREARATPYFDGAAVAVARPGRNHMKKGVDEAGRAFREIRSAGKVYRYYDDEGVPPDSVWSDISHLQQRDPERTGYPTQKPEKLLERIVLASSPPGALVADLFCGSGTTLATAQRLGRRWLGCDLGAAAVATTTARLRALGATFDVVKA